MNTQLKQGEQIVQIQLGTWDTDTTFIIALTNHGRILEKGNLGTAEWGEIPLPPREPQDDVIF